MEMQGQANVSATGHGIWVAIPAVFQALNVQMHTWSTYLQQYAANIESHHASFRKATTAIANSHGMDHALEASLCSNITEAAGWSSTSSRWISEPGSLTSCRVLRRAG